MDDFKSIVPHLVNILKVVDQLVNIAVAHHIWEQENLIIVFYYVYAIMIKHLMTAPSGNICFVPSYLDVSLDFVWVNIKILEKQNRGFSREHEKSPTVWLLIVWSNFPSETFVLFFSNLDVSGDEDWDSRERNRYFPWEQSLSV